MGKRLLLLKEQFAGLPAYIILSGWIVFGGFLLVEYSAYDPHSLNHLLEIKYPASALHLVMLLFPFISTALGYLVNERITLHKEALSYQEKLEYALSSWRATFDSMPYGVALIDTDFKILRANDYLARLCDMHVQEIVGRKCHDALGCGLEDKPDVCPLRKSLVSFNTETSEYYYEKLNRHFLLETTPVVGDEGILYVHSVIDITELKEKGKKLIQNKDAFFNMLKDLDISYKELKSLFNGLIFAFADALDAKSQWTRGHSERVTAYALSIAKEMGLADSELETLKTAAILHDIGKIGTYDAVLDKPGRLTEEEFELVKKHPGKGAEILRHIKQLESAIPILKHHHERVDGNGYPDRLKSEDIPLLARILCVADAYDAMTADRPYRQGLSKDIAIEELKRCSGTQFTPEVVEAFIRLLQP